MGYESIGFFDSCYDAIPVHIFQIREEDQRQESFCKCINIVQSGTYYILYLLYYLSLHIFISIDDLACIDSETFCFVEGVVGTASSYSSFYITLQMSLDSSFKVVLPNKVWL